MFPADLAEPPCHRHATEFGDRSGRAFYRHSDRAVNLARCLARCVVAHARWQVPKVSIITWMLRGWAGFSVP